MVGHGHGAAEAVVIMRYEKSVRVCGGVRRRKARSEGRLG
jgi:hypothetical protein